MSFLKPILKNFLPYLYLTCIDNSNNNNNNIYSYQKCKYNYIMEKNIQKNAEIIFFIFKNIQDTDFKIRNINKIKHYNNYHF